MKKDFDFLELENVSFSLITNLNSFTSQEEEEWLCPYCLQNVGNFFNYCESCEKDRANSPDVDKPNTMSDKDLAKVLCP